jgi:hypothetical protein
MRSRRCSGPGRLLGDTKVFGRRVTCKAPLAHVEGGSGRFEASPNSHSPGYSQRGREILGNSEGLKGIKGGQGSYSVR